MYTAKWMGQRLRTANLGSRGANSERVKGVDLKGRNVFEGKVIIIKRTSEASGFRENGQSLRFRYGGEKKKNLYCLL